MGNKETSLAFHFNNTSRERDETKLQQARSWWGHHSLTTPDEKPDQSVLLFWGDDKAQEH